MLRITVHNNPGTLTFQVEGGLEGPVVLELEACWRSTLARRREPTLRVDLTEMTSLDAAGKACLAALHRQGAEFIAGDCLTKAIVTEITGAPGESTDAVQTALTGGRRGRGHERSDQRGGPLRTRGG